MTNKLLSPVANSQLFDNDGKMLAGGTITVYRAGTLSLAKIYANVDGGALVNPIVLNASGRIPNGQLCLDVSFAYDIQIKKGTTVLETYNDIFGLIDSSTGVFGSSIVDSFTGTGTTLIYTLSQTPDDIASTTVIVNGLTLTPTSDYLLAGNQLTFVIAPTLGDEIVVRFNRVVGNLSGAQRDKIYNAWTTTSGTLNYTLTNSPGSINNLTVVLNGLVLKPSIDYTWSAGLELTLSLVANPGTGKELSASYGDILPIIGTTTTDTITYSTTAEYLTTALDNLPATLKYQSGLAGSVERTIQSKLRESVSVVDFGAIPGDNIANALTNSTAFAAAVGAAYANGIDVYIPAGIWHFGEHTWFMGHYRKIIGAGKHATILKWAWNTGTVSPYAILLDQWNSIRDLTILNSGTNTTTSIGICSYTPTAANGAANCVYNNLNIEGFGIGTGDNANQAQSLVFNTTFTDCTFYNNFTDIKYGAGSNNTVFKSCWFRSSRGVSLSLNTTLNFKFDACAFEGGADRNIDLLAAQSTMFDTCYFEPMKGALVDTSPNTTFDNCIVEGGLSPAPSMSLSMFRLAATQQGTWGFKTPYYVSIRNLTINTTSNLSAYTLVTNVSGSNIVDAWIENVTDRNGTLGGAYVNTTLKTITPTSSNALLGSVPTDFFKQFNVFQTAVANSGTVNLGSIGSRIGLMMVSVGNSTGTFQSVYSVGVTGSGSVINRLTTEPFTSAQYSLTITAGNLILTNLSGVTTDVGVRAVMISVG